MVERLFWNVTHKWWKVSAVWHSCTDHTTATTSHNLRHTTNPNKASDQVHPSHNDGTPRWNWPGTSQRAQDVDPRSKFPRSQSNYACMGHCRTSPILGGPWIWFGSEPSGLGNQTSGVHFLCILRLDLLESDLFQHVHQVLNRIWIWGLWRLGQHPNPFPEQSLRCIRTQCFAGGFLPWGGVLGQVFLGVVCVK